MGLGVVPIFAGCDQRRAPRPAVGLRHHRRPLRGARVRRHRLGQPARRHRRQDRLPRRPRPRRRARPRLPGAVGGGRRRLRHRRARRAARHLPDRRHHHRRRLRTRSSDDELAERYRQIAEAIRQEGVPSVRGAGSRMSMPFYVAPEQVMKDRADYARKGIARGRALVALRYADGIAIVAENSSETLRKVSEIYDRIAFAGVGKYNEFDQLRVAGVRAADLKGFQYSRDDVDARSLANQYAQILGQIFTHEMKPMEVEILVAEVGVDARRRPDVPHPLRRHGVRPARLHGARRRRRRHHRPHRPSPSPTASTRRRAVRAGAAALGGPDRDAAGRRPRGRPAAAGQRAALLPAPHRRRRSPASSAVEPCARAGRPRA